MTRLRYALDMHSIFMHRCLELAEHGRGKVSPNPLVGCVITMEVSDTRYQASGDETVIIAEGWHEEFGEKHAEINAIGKCVGAQRAVPLQNATLYVNIEPCCHEGKQPPCINAIIKAGIKKIVFGARDPLHGGADILRKTGIEVIGPVLEAECRRQNRGFFSLAEQGRPWVTLKKALMRDGHVKHDDAPRGKPLKITSGEQDAWAHARLRATHDAILVGSGTVLADNPQLNVRHTITAHSLQITAQPRRVILDPHGEVPPTAAILTDEDAHRTLVIREKLPIPELLERLKQENIASVLVEGGPRVWQSFEESGCVDEMVTLVGA